MKWHCYCVTLFVLELAQSFVCMDMRDNGIDSLARSCNGAVDAFAGKENGAEHATIQAGLEQWSLQMRIVRHLGKLIQRCHYNLLFCRGLIHVDAIFP